MPRPEGIFACGPCRHCLPVFPLFPRCCEAASNGKIDFVPDTGSERYMSENTMATTQQKPRWLRKHFAIPSEHGAWAMWLGPFAVGLGIAWRFNLSVLWALWAMLLLFLARQPMIIFARALSGRRSRSDAFPALIWLAIYGGLAVIPLTLLIGSGRSALLRLVLPAFPALAWQLWLVTRRAERQMTVELAGSGALALAGPGAYYAATGHFDFTALFVWLLCWFQSAAAIVYVYLRLKQRRLPAVPTRQQLWAMGWRTLMYHAFNFAASVVLSVLRILPPLVPLAFAAMLAMAIHGTFRPAVGVKPQVLGFAQVGATVGFVVLLVLAYRLA